MPLFQVNIKKREVERKVIDFQGKMYVRARSEDQAREAVERLIERSGCELEEIDYYAGDDEYIDAVLA